MTDYSSRLRDKVFIITGAASPNGIGFATASRLASEGAKVVLTDVEENAVQARAQELGAAGFDAIGQGHDVTSEAGWNAVVTAVLGRHGRIDGLVNNAGIVRLAPIEDYEMANWHLQLNVNLTGTFLGCRAVIAQLRRQGSGGAIVNVSSIAGLIGMRRTSAYSASKGGVRLLTKTLAIECGGDGIRVNSVHPGVTQTDMQTDVRKGPSDSAAITAAIPLGHMGTPQHLASAIVFLLSDDAAYITGAELAVDGGLTAQ